MLVMVQQMHLNFIGARYKMQQVLWSNFIGFSAGYGAKLLHTQISLVRAGYEASGSSTSNFIGLQAGYQAKCI
jgi:hypothetical protein